MKTVNIPARLGILAALWIPLNSSAATADDPLAGVGWDAEARKGDATRGRELFRSDRLDCVRCHETAAAGRSRGGPNLAAILRRQTPTQVVESIRFPDRTIAQGFESERVRIRDGLEVVGLVVSEANAKVTVLLGDGVRKAFHRGEVLDRAPRPGSIMPPGKSLTLEELRDLLAYLGTL